MDAFIVDQQFRTAEQQEIVLAFGASGEEVKAAFAAPEEQRDGRQRKIVRVIVQNGADTALAFATLEHSLHAGRLWWCYVSNKKADGLATCFRSRQSSSIGIKGGPGRKL